MSEHVQNFSLKCKEVIGKSLGGGGEEWVIWGRGRFRKDLIGSGVESGYTGGGV